MYKVDAQQAAAQPVTTAGAANVQIQWLIDESQGAPNFSLRRFIVWPGGHTPRHSHFWEHEVYVLRGRGLLVTDEGEIELGQDQAIFLPPDQIHQFFSYEDETLEMLCMVPHGPATEGHSDVGCSGSRSA